MWINFEASLPAPPRSVACVDRLDPLDRPSLRYVLLVLGGDSQAAEALGIAPSSSDAGTLVGDAEGYR